MPDTLQEGEEREGEALTWNGAGEAQEGEARQGLQLGRSQSTRELEANLWFRLSPTTKRMRSGAKVLNEEGR